ncbi:hypothetical protein GF382_02945 [Candidatus Falkowbacteria bacterium]|nr:hypothetical protein [Candidatus Falkowbacteria bacterium]
MNKKKAVKRNRRVLSIAICCILAAILAGVYIYAAVLHSKKDVERLRDLKKSVKEYLSSHQYGQESWWLRSSDMRGGDNIQIAAKLTDEETKKITDMLYEYQDVSPLAQKMIMQTLDSGMHPKVSIYQRGDISMTFSFKKEEMKDVAKMLKNSIEICYIPKDIHDNYPASLSYRSDWNALMIKGINWPPALYAGLLFHEFGHYYKHKIEGANSATAPMTHESWAEEEVAMHELEAEVMNRATKGRLFTFVDSLNRRYEGIDKMPKHLNGLQADHFFHLDEIIGCQSSSNEVNSVAISQYLFIIGFRYINERIQCSESDKMKLKIHLYRWMQKNLDRL